MEMGKLTWYQIPIANGIPLKRIILTNCSDISQRLPDKNWPINDELE
jgi:hypothetical protein